MTVIGVDVSRYQPNWKPRPEDKYVIIKATQGTTVLNPERTKQVKTGRDAGLLVGHYHYMEKGNAVAQAEYFVQHADIQPGDTLWCDWEGDWAAGRHPTVEDAAKFIAQVKKLKPDHKVGLYCNASDWKSTAVKRGDALWIAHYTSAARPDVQTDWDLWQFTDKDNLDQNRSRLPTLQELGAWWTGKPAPAPTPGTKFSFEWDTAYVSMNGEWVTPIDKIIISTCAKEVGWEKHGPVNIIQGGMSKGTLSAKTHYGFGGYDLQTRLHPFKVTWELSGCLIRSGIVGFIRGPKARDGFDPHMHLASRESEDHAHEQLQRQIDEFLRGGDGLVGPRKFYGPDVKLGTWKQSPYNPANISEDSGLYVVNTTTDPLLGVSVDRKIITRLPKGSNVQAVKRVKRWDRDNVVTAEETYFAAELLVQTA